MDYEHFYPELGSIFPGYPWLAFDRALNISARTLCRLGLVWRAEAGSISWIAGRAEYALTIPPDSYIVQLLDGGGLTPTTPHQLAYLDAAWRDRVGRPTHYYPLPGDAIRVYPKPAESEPSAFTTRVALAPTPEAAELSDDYALAHERLLLSGAVANLGKASWPEFEHTCHGVRSFSTDERHIGVPRKVRYGGL